MHLNNRMRLWRCQDLGGAEKGDELVLVHRQLKNSTFALTSTAKETTPSLPIHIPLRIPADEAAQPPGVVAVAILVEVRLRIVPPAGVEIGIIHVAGIIAVGAVVRLEAYFLLPPSSPLAFM